MVTKIEEEQKRRGETKTGSRARHNYHNKTGNSGMRLTSLLQLAAFRYHLPMLVKVSMNTSPRSCLWAMIYFTLQQGKTLNGK